MTDTPECEEAASFGKFSGYPETVPYSLAQRLERERDQWKERYAKVYGRLAGAVAQCDPFWRPIETAPKDRRILAWEPGEGAVTLDWDEECGWGQESDSGRWTHFAPTHWMPIPTEDPND